MANVSLIVVNPTDAAVTVNAQTVQPRSALALTIADTGFDAYGFLAAKCLLVSKTAGVASDFEKAGFLAERLARFA